MAYDPIKNLTQGRWKSILPKFDISGQYLTGKHCPCPICGGKDRFRFDNKEGNGTFFCTHCGAGDGISLIKLKTGMGFKSICDAILPMVADAVVEAKALNISDEEKRKNAVGLWRNSKQVVQGDAVCNYLFKRLGLKNIPRSLKFASRVKYYDGAQEQFYPAMVALVQNCKGEPVSVHRTYLTNAGDKAAISQPKMLAAGKIPHGSAIRLAAAAPVMGIAEGIETALAAQSMFGLPVWAAINTAFMECWMPPVGVKEVLIFADNDSSFAGQKAAYNLAFRLSNSVKVAVKLPIKPDTDWCDEYQKEMHLEAAQ